MQGASRGRRIDACEVGSLLQGAVSVADRSRKKREAQADFNLAVEVWFELLRYLAQGLFPVGMEWKAGGTAPPPLLASRFPQALGQVPQQGKARGPAGQAAGK